MKIIIDADACPVSELCISIGNEYGLEIILVSDYNHELDYEGVKYICVPQGQDRSDYEIFSLVDKGDIVITGDGGLANLVLGKSGLPLSFSGFLYTLDNIDAVLMQRHLNAKERKFSKRYTKIPKRTLQDDEKFEKSLLNLIKKRYCV